MGVLIGTTDHQQSRFPAAIWIDGPAVCVPELRWAVVWAKGDLALGELNPANADCQQAGNGGSEEQRSSMLRACLHGKLGDGRILLPLVRFASFRAVVRRVTCPRLSQQSSRHP